MENASKALIIAGAILVSILIIGLGMTLYNNAAGTLERANIDETAVRQYNASFTSYDGQTNVKGANIKALIRDVITHNRTYRDDNSLWINVIDKYQVETTNRATEVGNLSEYIEGIEDILKEIKNGTVYTVNCWYDNSTGYVIAISIYPTTTSVPESLPPV